MLVKKLINKPVDSNTYILSDLEFNNCLIIDPGNPDISEIIEYYNDIERVPSAILHKQESLNNTYGVN
jgi:glyoxylase-like metal-dependent hydrolase (beta-lactamase superfamily II)